MAQWRQPRTSLCPYAVSKCERGPDGTACRDEPAHGEPPGTPSCPICQRVKSAIFQGIVRDRALEIAVEALDPDMPAPLMGSHWNPWAAPPPVPARPHVLPDPSVRPKVKAYVRRVGGASQVFRQILNTGNPPPPPPPPHLGGGAAGVGVASIPISPAGASGGYAPTRTPIVDPASGGKAPARGAVRPPTPPLPPPVGAMLPHAGQGGQIPSHAPPVGAMLLHAGQGGQIPSHAPASGLQGPASGSHGIAFVSQSRSVWIPPPPAGPPPRAVPAVDSTITRRTFASVNTLQQVERFSQSLHSDTGSALLESINAVGRSEIASTVRLTVMKRWPLPTMHWRLT